MLDWINIIAAALLIGVCAELIMMFIRKRMDDD